jgi:hypothetical protein
MDVTEMIFNWLVLFVFVALIFFINLSFNRLAVKYGKSRRWYGVLGLLVFFLSLGLSSQIEMLLRAISPPGNLLNTLSDFMRFPFGLLAWWGFYKFLKNRWSEGAEQQAAIGEKERDAEPSNGTWKGLKDVDDKYVFDKAKYHDNSVAELGLSDSQSFVHTGLFLAWLVNNELMSDFFVTETGKEVENLKVRRSSPIEIYEEWDGVLIGEMLTRAGFNFALDYFDFERGTYLKDYERVFKVTSKRVYEVKGTWDNYDKLKPTIDAAYEKWRNKIIDAQ